MTTGGPQVRSRRVRRWRPAVHDHEQQPEQRQRAGEQEGGGEDRGDDLRTLRRPEQGAATPELRRCRPACRAEVGDLGDRGEAVALRPEPLDEQGQRGHGLRAVAAGVVEQDDGALPVLRDGVPDDRVHARPLPVPGVDVREDGDVAVVVGVLDELPVLVVERVRGERVRRAHERRRPARHADERELLLGELPALLPRRLRGQVRVPERVVADLVALRHLPADDVGVAQRLAPEQEERGGHVLAGEDVEDLRRPRRVGAVVERQRDGLRRHRRESRVPACGPMIGPPLAIDGGTSSAGPAGRTGRHRPARR